MRWRHRCWQMPFGELFKVILFKRISHGRNQRWLRRLDTALAVQRHMTEVAVSAALKRIEAELSAGISCVARPHPVDERSCLGTSYIGTDNELEALSRVWAAGTA